MAYLNVATEFYPRPAGRFYTDGNHSGEKFRTEYLLPRIKELKSREKLTVDFSGVTMAGSSFLEESFGGLVRVEHFSKDHLLSVLDILTDRQIIKDRIYEYIKDA